MSAYRKFHMNVMNAKSANILLSADPWAGTKWEGMTTKQIAKSEGWSLNEVRKKKLEVEQSARPN